ncbi:relaxase/mobilization nuclease domain-containing protein [Amorphus orientalis]|uniref:Murein DD-endopeptidase MepM/ murein hydrolase activator NlpD n=1 Tax=Amorphus orientalis TaxID=649198 RepID=A0AAE3VMC4_9HYPH|nr:relaxase/mobilization nuclease domain-containing protein [Amorphus orientalis]MDQ0314600.1 murein DD-endopeptidase MepM/ murein hydrolase activator NlpD [Amorphus orientalis]
MILHGNQRGGARDLAIHLTKPENERVEIHELRGFVSDTLEGAFQESYALSRATRCKQHLYSLSINPPANADIEAGHFVDAANRAEKQLGLDGQPRAIVFHDKRGMDGELRRHAHVVWCRIDPETMTARQLSYDKTKLREVSRELHIDHDLKMPPGLQNSKDRNPRNFTLEEWQQCKRAEKDPRAVKEAFQDCWSISDSRQAFASALEERGYILAQGRRGHVAVDYKGEKYAVSRYVGIKAKDVRARLGKADDLPSIEHAQEKAARQIAERLKELEAEQKAEIQTKREREAEQKRRTEAAQEREAAKLQEEQRQRQSLEDQARQERIRHGLWGLWDRITGKRKEAERLNAQEAAQARERDRREAERLEQEQARQRERERQRAQTERRKNEEAVQEIRADVEQLPPEPPKDVQQARDGPDKDVRPPEHVRPKEKLERREPPRQAPQPKAPANPEPVEQPRSYAEEQRARTSEAQQGRSHDGPTLER